MQRGQVQVWIDAPPERVYALISDVTRMGEWSPECFRCEWTGGATAPIVGARFRGWNRWRGFTWWRDVRVTVAEPGREFAFTTIPARFPRRDSTLWRYVLEPVDGGTLITESFEVVWIGLEMRLLEPLTGRPKGMVPGMQRTLHRLKAAAEGEIATSPARVSAERPEGIAPTAP